MDNVFDTAGFPGLLSTLRETVQTVGDDSHFEGIRSLIIHFSFLAALSFLLLSKPGSRLILVIRVISLSACVFVAYNYHSECLENSLQTLIETYVAEKQALEATYSTNFANLLNAFKALQTDHQSQQIDCIAIISERDELKALNYQYAMDENSAQQRINNLFKTFPEFAHILLEQPHQIESDVVFKLDGSPNRAIGSGRKFSKPKVMTGFVVKDGKRVSITLSVSFEE